MAVKLSGRQADARDGSTGPQAKQWAVECVVGGAIGPGGAPLGVLI